MFKCVFKCVFVFVFVFVFEFEFEFVFEFEFEFGFEFICACFRMCVCFLCLFLSLCLSVCLCAQILALNMLSNKCHTSTMENDHKTWGKLLHPGDQIRISERIRKVSKIVYEHLISSETLTDNLLLKW